MIDRLLGTFNKFIDFSMTIHKPSSIINRVRNDG